MTEADDTDSSDTGHRNDLEVMMWLLLTLIVVCILNNTISSSMVQRWLWSLTRGDIKDYDYDYQDPKAIEEDDVCCICQENFIDSTDGFRGTCIPIHLNPCGHVIGHKCFSRWIESFDATPLIGFMRCPYCTKFLTRKPRAFDRRAAQTAARLVATIKSSDFMMVLLGYNRVQQPAPMLMDPSLGLRLLQGAAECATQILGVAYGVYFVWSTVLMLAYFVSSICAPTHTSDILLRLIGMDYFGYIMGTFMLSSATLMVFDLLLGNEAQWAWTAYLYGQWI